MWHSNWASFDQRHLIAEQARTSQDPNFLQELSTCVWWSVRKEVAYNPMTPPETLAELATDTNSEVRCWVAVNPKTPFEVLAKLALDDNYSVRFFLARNPSTPSCILSVLAQDESHVIQREARDHHNAPEWVKVASRMRKL